ncbi:MAG: hypothetical protein GC155_16675 [Alphaproteobacteria bacterium]|nr:hypothetical protein [Alphaproteobacteria bacterium]
MPDLQSFLHAIPTGLLDGFAGRVVDSLLVGAVVAWLLSLGRGRDRRAARAQVAEQLCRVFSLRLYRPRKSKALALEELQGRSLRGWPSLERLQWSLDLHRAQLSTRELTLMQALIEDLLRIRANQLTAELHILDEYLPGAARSFLPPSLREKFLDHARYIGLPYLIDGPAPEDARQIA